MRGAASRRVLDSMRAGTLTGRLATTDDVTGTACSCSTIRPVNGVNIDLEGGRLLK